MESAEASSLGHRLLKRRNVDFLLGEDTIVVDIPDEDTLKQSEGMKEGATELPRDPKEESIDTAAESVFDVYQKVGHKGTPISPVRLLARGNPIEGSIPIPPTAPTLYIPR